MAFLLSKVLLLKGSDVLTQEGRAVEPVVKTGSAFSHHPRTAALHPEEVKGSENIHPVGWRSSAITISKAELCT